MSIDSSGTQDTHRSQRLKNRPDHAHEGEKTKNAFNRADAGRFPKNGSSWRSGRKTLDIFIPRLICGVRRARENSSPQSSRRAPHASGAISPLEDGEGDHAGHDLGQSYFGDDVDLLLFTFWQLAMSRIAWPAIDLMSSFKENLLPTAHSERFFNCLNRRTAASTSRSPPPLSMRELTVS